MSALIPIQSEKYDELRVNVYASSAEVGRAAAQDARDILYEAVTARGEAFVVLATGNAQLTFLHTLRELDGIEWSKITIFHLDEFIGLTDNHPASFAVFLRQHFVDHVKPRAFFPVPGAAKDTEAACNEYERMLREHNIDLMALGIGENGHIAFNDPPKARFNEPAGVKVVRLVEESRQQQVNEGHFEKLEDVPAQAITVTIPLITAARALLCIVPEARKAEAVRRTLKEPVDESCPASILRRAAQARLYLDLASASKLE